MTESGSIAGAGAGPGSASGTTTSTTGWVTGIDSRIAPGARLVVGAESAAGPGS